jgi:hypothetical protein
MLNFNFCLLGLAYSDADPLTITITMDDQVVYTGTVTTTHPTTMPSSFTDTSQVLAQWVWQEDPPEIPREMVASIAVSGGDSLCGIVLEDFQAEWPRPNSMAIDEELYGTPEISWSEPYIKLQQQAKDPVYLDGTKWENYYSATENLAGAWKYPIRSGSTLTWTYKFFYLGSDLSPTNPNTPR